ncbi:MAG: hypothetical protein JRJ21_06615 [Deltaproteobacteria bacterium]|nr:hypothetical protein [Deltaproteobacteria bacterium]MBW2614908.1 hypothetical protein [Deltaproteobacteria bacterium]
MTWDIFFNRNRVRRSKEKDEIDLIVDVIEKFAPKQYRSERSSFYYNYRIMAPYRKPLLSLLETISQRQHLESDPADFARDLFLKLKGFYDPKDRLSMAEAIEDTGLKKKFREIFLFFYGTKDSPDMNMNVWNRGVR